MSKAIKTRRAVSLVELLVVMSACSLILTMSAAVVHRVMRIQSETRSFFNIERSALRLAGQFRRDVHQANVAQIEGGNLGEGVVVRLEVSGDQTVEYGHIEGNVLRTLSQNGKILSREEFSFPPSIQLAIRREDSPSRLVLTISAEPPDSAVGESKQRWRPDAMTVSLQVEARLRHDRGIADVTPEQEQAE